MGDDDRGPLGWKVSLIVATLVHGGWLGALAHALYRPTRSLNTLAALEQSQVLLIAGLLAVVATGLGRLADVLIIRFLKFYSGYREINRTTDAGKLVEAQRREVDLRADLATLRLECKSLRDDLMRATSRMIEMSREMHALQDDKRQLRDEVHRFRNELNARALANLPPPAPTVAIEVNPSAAAPPCPEDQGKSADQGKST